MALRDVVRGFFKETSGNVAMMFALASGVLLTGSAAAIDYSRYSNARTAALTAADAAAVAGAKTQGTPAAREEAARKVFSANFRSSGAVGEPEVRYINILQNGVSVGYRVEAEVEVKAVLGAFTSTTSQRVSAASEAKATFDDPTEVVFVLDTTDSMEGARMAALKSSTTAIIDEMTRRVSRPDLLKIGVVPFAQYVNVGLANRGKAWLNVPSDYQEPSYDWCRQEAPVIGQNNCRMVTNPAQPATPPGTCYRDGVPFSCGGNPYTPASTSQVCDNVYGPSALVCTRIDGRWIQWNGCVGSRDYPLETMDSRYDVRIPGIMDVTCGTPIQNLTTDTAAVRSMINSLVTSGETYLPAGLIWGWRMLSPGEPLSAAASGPGGARKFMILVTDGRNTLSPTYPTHTGNDGALADRLTRETCTNLAADRASAIKLYTIAFEMDGLDAKTILSNCAGQTGGAFYDAGNATLLRESLGKAMDSIFAVKLTH